jgi:hypothetical protein
MTERSEVQQNALGPAKPELTEVTGPTSKMVDQ